MKKETIKCRHRKIENSTKSTDHQSLSRHQTRGKSTNKYKTTKPVRQRNTTLYNLNPNKI